MFASRLSRSSHPYAIRDRLLAAALLCVGLMPGPVVANPKWDSIPPAELAATECKSYPGSSAEVLFHRTTLDASRIESWCNQYARIKIYSPKGVEEAGVLNLEYRSSQTVSDLSARVTKPDGNAIEYGKDSFTDTLVAKTQDAKLKRKTLAVPSLGEGDVVEMQWTVTFDAFSDSFWYCQEAVPVREYTFAVNALKSDYNIFSFNVAKAEAKRINNSQTRLEMRDLPPFEREVVMAPMKDVRGWFMIVLSNRYLRWYSKPDEIWKLISTYEEETFRLLTKPGAVIKAKALEVVQGAVSDNEKLKKLYDFCQANIDNLSYFDTPELQKAKEKLKNDNDQSPAQTLQRKSGYPDHITELFAALARAAGYQVRLALCASRYNTLNVQNAKGWLFVNDSIAAVRVGDKWRLYCPGDYYTPAGMIDPSNEFASYLRCEEDQVVFGQVPVSPAAMSPVARRARFQIDSDGNLEGDVEVRMGGHAGSSRKHDWATKQSAEIDDDFRAAITSRLPGVEVSDLAWENLRGNTLPLIVRYKVKVPGYAEMAGSRLVFAPNFFAHKSAALFTAERRQHPVFFDYAYSEHDDIDYSLPEGFALQAPSAPNSVGDLGGAIGVKYELAYKRKSRVLSYHRDYSLGGDGSIAFQAASYPALKSLSDAIARSDEHSLMLAQAPAPPVVPADTTLQNGPGKSAPSP